MEESSEVSSFVVDSGEFLKHALCESGVSLEEGISVGSFRTLDAFRSARLGGPSQLCVIGRHVDHGGS